VIHLTRALAFRLPEHVWLQVQGWRASALFRLGRHPESLRDNLRVLVGLSYLDMSQSCPPLEAPGLPIFSGFGCDSPENLLRVQDYRRYREHVDRQLGLAAIRFGAIDLIRMSLAQGKLTDADIRKALGEVSPDKSRPEIVLGWLNADIQFPRCSR
jgi:hypothetical protein